MQNAPVWSIARLCGLGPSWLCGYQRLLRLAAVARIPASQFGIEGAQGNSLVALVLDTRIEVVMTAYAYGPAACSSRSGTVAGLGVPNAAATSRMWSAKVVGSSSTML